MVAQPPEVGLGTRKARAVNTRLLACPDADDGPAVCVGNAVRLCVLQRESGDNEVRESLVGKLEDC